MSNKIPGIAPNRKNKAAELYRAQIPARPGTAKNNATLGEAHINTHSCSTLVKYGLEMAAMYPEYVTCISCDNNANFHFTTLVDFSFMILTV